MERVPSKNLVRQINEHDVLQTIFNAGPISRSQVAQQLGLNKVTVSDIFNDLIDQGLIIDVGEGASSQNGGRKPTMIKFNARYGYIVSFDFGASYIDQLVTYLDGSIISYAHFSVTDMTVPDRLAFIAERIEKVDVPFAMHQLIGIAVSVPGIVDDQQIVYSPFAELVGTDIVGFLHTRFAVPVLLENGANSAAIYERDFNGAPNADTNLVAISIYQGIGAGIITTPCIVVTAARLAKSAIWCCTKRPRPQLLKQLSNLVPRMPFSVSCRLQKTIASLPVKIS